MKPGTNMVKASKLFILPFGTDGEPVGLGIWERSTLSEKWLSLCKEFLAAHGAVFEAPWEGSLSHVRTKMTSASGAALVTLLVHEKVVLSILLLSGLSPPAEDSVARMFVASLNRIVPVLEVVQSQNPFEDIFTTKDRPLMAVVPWPEPTVSEQDHGLVRDLGLHLAGAFFAM